MNKKLIIIMIMGSVGLAGFAGMFSVAWFTKKPAQPQIAEAGQIRPPQQVEQMQSQQEQNELKLTKPQIPVSAEAVGADNEMKRAMTEKQLKSLIYEVREKIQEYNRKLKALEVQEQRLQSAQETLKKDIKHLGDLRIELASTVARLKDEQDRLLKTRVQISETEKNNLISIAAAYDKMDSTSASEILTNLSRVKSSESDDAVKILYYMSERTKAKVLASIAEKEPAVSAYFCQKLKQIAERSSN